MRHIFAVSDGTGRTAEQTLKAALTQFAGAEVKVKRWSDVRTEEKVRQVVREAAAVHAFIVHTLVSDEMRAVMLRQGRLHDVETIDLLGPLLARLSQQFAHSPAEKPGLFGQLNEAYFRRVETMDFAFRHDDGQRVRDLPKAEIVLVGVSRTFKTPLSIYLAFKGWLVANVPMVLDLPPPPILKELPPERVIGLTTEPQQLAALRRTRHERFGGATGDYADYEHVRQELIYAHNYFRSPPRWQTVDVTNKPIEEIASEILTLVRRAHTDDPTPG